MVAQPKPFHVILITVDPFIPFIASSIHPNVIGGLEFCVGILVLELEENGGEKFLDNYKVEYIISKVVLGARKAIHSLWQL